MKGADPKFQGWPESLRKWYTASLRSDHLTTCTSEGPWNEHLDAQLEIFWASKTVGRGRAPTTLTALWIGQQGQGPYHFTDSALGVVCCRADYAAPSVLLTCRDSSENET